MMEVGPPAKKRHHAMIGRDRGACAGADTIFGMLRPGGCFS